jgi:putative ABC transport system substrate-binding protein
MTGRRETLTLFCAMLAAPRALVAQTRIARIGYLVESPLTDPPSAERKALIEGLRDFGYVEGRNLTIEYRSAEGVSEFLPIVTEELVRSRVELIFTVTSPAVAAAMKASPTIPIVCVIAADPVQNGFAQSLARPGKNVTGIALLGTDLAAKRLQLIRELLPRATRVAVMWARDVGTAQAMERIRQAAPRLAFDLQVFGLRNAADLTRQMDLIAKAAPDALLVVESNVTIAARRIIAEFALAQRLPSVMGFAGYAAAGGLISYAPSIADAFRHAAVYVDKILKGAKPADLPIEQATRLELVVNLKTAKSLGVTVAQSLMLRADELIE